MLIDVQPISFLETWSDQESASESFQMSDSYRLSLYSADSNTADILELCYSSPVKAVMTYAAIFIFLYFKDWCWVDRCSWMWKAASVFYLLSSDIFLHFTTPEDSNTHILQTAFYLWNKQNSLKLTYISISRMLTRRPSETATVANVVMMLCNKLTVDLFSSKREINTLARNILSVGGNQTLR